MKSEFIRICREVVVLILRESLVLIHLEKEQKIYTVADSIAVKQAA
jgi:hypothetical protein